MWKNKGRRIDNESASVFSHTIWSWKSDCETCWIAGFPGEDRNLPVFIPGTIDFVFLSFFKIYTLQFFGLPEDNPFVEFPYCTIDWNPAKEPYDIEVW